MATWQITELNGFMEFMVSRESVSTTELEGHLVKCGVRMSKEEYLVLLDKISKEEGIHQPILSILTYGNPYQTAQTTVVVTMSEIDGLWTLWAIEKDGRFRAVCSLDNLRDVEENAFAVVLESIV